MIHVNQLEFTFPGASQPLFKALDLNVPKGRTRTLIGPSGSGKTTLIKLLAGLLVPDKGDITLDDTPVRGSDKARAAVRNHQVGLIFQDYNLLPQLTAMENLQLRRAVAGLPAADDTPLLERVGLADVRNAPAHQLSGGQQQRLAAVRALITNPSVVLADEPTGNLDDASARLILELLEHPDTPRTTLIATHDPRVLAHFGEPLDLMRPGVFD